MSDPRPVTVIGGYLGAGKTTLINQMLRHADGLRIAVLVNEFGELSIDDDLIEAEEDGILSIAGGCVCCSFGDDLIGALVDLSSLTPPPDHIVIEASGVAIPSSIAASLSLLVGFELGATVVLADAERVRKLGSDKYVGDTILRQLTDADIVVATKTDLVDGHDLHATMDWLEETADGARIVPADQGKIPLDVTLGPRPDRPTPTPSPHSDRLFESRVMSAADPLDAGLLARALAKSELGLVRAKGVITDLDGHSVLIQNVGERANTTITNKPATGIVCIGVRGQVDWDAVADVFTAA